MDSHALQQQQPDASSNTTNGVGSLSNGAPKDTQLPPELEHWAHTYVPMGKLLERMAQQCYHDLSEVIDQMADLTITTPHVNGASNSAPDASPQSVDKKLRIMNFANTQKDRFIKARVLSDWARNMADMDRMIELRMWLQQQDDASSLVSDGIMRLKHNMIPAKMPNPNIDGALELLSTSKAPWVPDLGYIPPKPLSAHKLLKTLRDMNFALSVRLNLHEQLPAHFCTYSIANGRATFVVPHEFELDLAVADEDPTSPFYFIDIRFLFSDAPPLADGFVRSSLEGKLNQVLELDGLSACYDFLHGFVLTHKITLLRRQAFELSRSRWTECLHVEPVHRSLIVQYWTAQPGGKSWIEIGITKGLNAEKRSHQPSNPVRLNIRWFRGGKEVPDANFHIDPANPSMEHILNQVTATHINLRLATINQQFRAISPSNSALTVDLNTSTTDPNACSLTMKLDQYGPDTTLRVIPVNGNICISPVNAISTDVERRLNANPSIDSAQIVSYLNCKLVQDQITRQAIQAGWLLMPTEKQQDVDKIFGEFVVKRVTFTRRGWGEDWAIAATISLNGLKWWVARLRTTQTGRSIQSAEALSISPSSKSFDRQTLISIESKAVAQVSLSNITSQLRNAKIAHTIRPGQPSESNRSPSISPTATAAVTLNFGALMQPHDLQLRKVWKPWCTNPILLTHHGVDESSREDVKVIHVLKITLLPHVAADLAPCINNRSSGEGIMFLPDGVCALQLRTHFGAGLVSLIQARLGRVERLSACLRAIKKRSFALDAVGVSGLTFRYQQTPSLQAGVSFADSLSTPMQLRFPVDKGNNPHRRIQSLLQKYLECPVPGVVEEAQRFENLLNILLSTLPLLRAVDTIESRDPSGLSAHISCRSATQYRLTYASPLPNVVIDISILRKAEKEYWVVQPAKEKLTNEAEMQTTREALQAAWTQGIDGVRGFTSGAITSTSAVEPLLLNLDAVVRQKQQSNHPQAANTATGPEVVVLD